MRKSRSKWEKYGNSTTIEEILNEKGTEALTIMKRNGVIDEILTVAKLGEMRRKQFDILKKLAVIFEGKFL